MDSGDRQLLCDKQHSLFIPTHLLFLLKDMNHQLICSFSQLPSFSHSFLDTIICPTCRLLLYSSQYWQLDSPVQLLWVENQATAPIHFDTGDKHILLSWLWFILSQVLWTWLSSSAFVAWNSNYDNNQLPISSVSSYIPFISWHLIDTTIFRAQFSLQNDFHRRNFVKHPQKGTYFHQTFINIRS